MGNLKLSGLWDYGEELYCQRQNQQDTLGFLECGCKYNQLILPLAIDQNQHYYLNEMNHVEALYHTFYDPIL